MRDRSTYRAARKNVPRGQEIKFLSGDNWKRDFEDNSKYVTPSKKERYVSRKKAKFDESNEAELGSL